MKHRLPSLIVVLMALAGPAFAERSAADLPSEGLENRIEFWKKIYTQYGKDDIVIHDRVRVNLIYDIADDSNVDSKTAEIDRDLKEIQSKLEAPETLSLAARQIRDAIEDEGVPLTKSSFDDLIENLHTQRGIKERFRDGVIRSGAFVDSFRQIMKAQGVLPELALLPLVESSFQNARSKAAALGVWQFTRSTGREYMTINSKRDERLDPRKSTMAAARLLHENYEALGSWPLAITAYNHGRAGMMRAKSEVGSDLPKIIDEYHGPVFGYASMNFYSEFLAAIDVYENYDQYFGSLVLDKPTGAAVSRPPLVKASLTTKATPKSQTARIAGKYKVRNGDTLYEIAQRFGTSIRELMAKNNLSRPHIYAGQILLIR